MLKGIIKPSYVNGKNLYFTQEHVDAYWRGEFVSIKNQCKRGM